MSGFKTILIAAAALAAAILPAKAQSSNSRINVLVMSDDADPDTVPRNNRIFNRVQLQLSEYLNTRGFQVYDETSTSLDVTTTGRVRRRDNELIEIARAVPTPIDAMVVYQIYASVRSRTGVDIRYPDIRIAARVLNVRSGQFISAFEVGGYQFPALAPRCDAECLLETVGGYSRQLATDLGSGIAQKVEAFVQPGGGASANKDGGPVVQAAADGCDNLPTDYEIKLRDFTPADVNRVESEFVRWGCYKQHRTVAMTDSSADFFYSTSSDSARLTRNFRLMLELVGINAQVSFAGNRVIVSKLATR
jgi:hypothetical protein